MDLLHVKQTVIDTIKQAGSIEKEYFTSQKFEQQSKGDSDIVTQVDTEIDAFIRKQLSQAFPEVHLMTEETTSGDYRYLKEKEWVFIVDALDGTINFTRRNPHFGIAIGLMKKGTMVLSVAYLPMKGELYVADERTKGAYLNDERINVSAISAMNKMVIGCDWSNNGLAREQMITILSDLSKKTRRIKCMGSPVADLCLVAKGDFDAYIHTRLRPWDITPAYIVQKAGGAVTNFSQDSWDIFRIDIVASNKVLAKQLAAMIPFTSSTEIK